MARISTMGSPPASRFPHPRGDGPESDTVKPVAREISPPTWGWPADPVRPHAGGGDFPTHVGMARWHRHSVRVSVRFPHPRGDGPPLEVIQWAIQLISPPTWGWPGGATGQVKGSDDFPTHVGMARGQVRLHQVQERFPHPRGDGPSFSAISNANFAISPPTWGWPEIHSSISAELADFPTHVGMARVLALIICGPV